MLGIEYLFRISLQHVFCIGLVILLLSELLSAEDSAFFERSASLMSSLIGLSVINLSFLYYAFSEELFLIQLLLGVVYLAALFCKKRVCKKEQGAQRRNRGVYIILLVLLVMELIY